MVCKHCSQLEEKPGAVLRIAVLDDKWQDDEIIRNEEEDPTLKHVTKWKKTDKMSTCKETAFHTQDIKSYWAQWKSFVLKDSLLKRVI